MDVCDHPSGFNASVNNVEAPEAPSNIAFESFIESYPVRAGNLTL